MSCGPALRPDRFSPAPPVAAASAVWGARWVGWLGARLRAGRGRGGCGQCAPASWSAGRDRPEGGVTGGGGGGVADAGERGAGGGQAVDLLEAGAAESGAARGLDAPAVP